MNKAIFTALIIFVATIVVAPASIQAISDSDLSRPDVTEQVDKLRDKKFPVRLPQERTNQLNEIRTMAQQQRCETVQVNMLARISFYKQNHERVMDRYEQNTAKVEQVIARLQQLGKNTAAAEQKLAEFKTMMQELANYQQQLVNALAAGYDYACVQEDGLRTKVDESKELLSQIRESIRQKNQFLVNELLPLLRQLARN